MRKLSKEKETTPILMAILDIDHFKKVNDTYGHLNGNVVLSTFSERLRAEVHDAFDPNCAVYRFGGEEFTIVIED